jgi:hypothetical protein
MEAPTKARTPAAFDTAMAPSSLPTATRMLCKMIYCFGLMLNDDVQIQRRVGRWQQERPGHLLLREECVLVSLDRDFTLLTYALLFVSVGKLTIFSGLLEHSRMGPSNPANGVSKVCCLQLLCY